MAFELTGIENVGEFYSAHYVSAVLQSDLKAVFDKWKRAKDEDGTRLPWEDLAGLARRYFVAAARAEGERNPSERLRLAQDVHAYLIGALGYERHPGVEPLAGDECIPVHLSLKRDGQPFLWILDAPFARAVDDDPLACAPLPEQLPSDIHGVQLPKSEENRGDVATWRELLDERLFTLDRPPRWVLFLAGREALLIERHKWQQGRYLRFDLGDLFGRKQTAALRAATGLLHKDVLAPDTGICLHDTLDENSHKHAHAVSADLKHGVRRAVERLANEAVYYRREVQKKGVFNSEDFSDEKLTKECLNWLYRLLFLFYVEARGTDIGVEHMKSEAYRKGYSLESLRDLELVPLATEQSRNGTFIHESLKTLFRILNTGFPTFDESTGGMERIGEMMLQAGDMRVEPLNSPLFDDDRLDILRSVRFRNFVLQEVLQLLSLSAQKKKKARGRISYAQLGINQLGAVYEGLLSYTGFFAIEDLYEVASEKDCKQLSGKPAAEREALKTYFVPTSRIGDYKEGEIVKDENERKVVHKKGTFIFRLAGRNREKSASYYTPEVLTQCLVKYALKELLWEEGEEGEKPRRKKTADEILALTICEPAMGSSAFLIEAVDQLADAYLEARQDEVVERGEDRIPPEDYQREKRRVKARLATNNCYGVDLNPTAVELAKVSLWLATLYEGGKCPWFGLRLAAGNSLVGARREVFKTSDVTRKGTKDNPNWLGLVPESVPLCHGASTEEGGPLGQEYWEHWIPPRRPKGTIYHFLLPAVGMAAFDKDKVIKELALESVRRIKEWRVEFCKPFNRKDAERLEQISDAVDRLFAQVVRERVLATQETSDRIPVWGEPQPSERGASQADLLVRDQEEVAASLEHQSSAYRRLKIAMDAWCALWFWPIEEANLLPDRATWLAQLELILMGKVTYEPAYEQQTLFAALVPRAQAELGLPQLSPRKSGPLHEATAGRLKRLQALSDAFRERRADYSGECGIADVDAMLDGDSSLSVAQNISERLSFHHWQLRFAEVFARRSGFDLVIGNPPWVKLSFDEGGVLSDFDASIATRKLNASEISSVRRIQLSKLAARDAYLEEFELQGGGQSFLGNLQNYPLLLGMKTNLYKCFITQAWGQVNVGGISALLHPEGVYSDPKGGRLRSDLYRRLRVHFQFINELSLFAEIAHIAKFSINVYVNTTSASVDVLHMSNLFHPSTVDGSFSHDGRGVVPAIKNELDEWDLSPHRSRIVNLDAETLGVFASLYDEPRTPALEARLPVVYSKEIATVLRRFAGNECKLAEVRGQYFSTQHWNETNAQKDNTMRRATTYPGELAVWIIQGPHIYIGTPLNKTANADCSSHGDYTAIDLTTIEESYLPRTNYIPNCDPQTYLARTPQWRGRPVTEFFRHLHRRFANPTIERTLISVLIPPGPGHINVCESIASESFEFLSELAALTASIPYDFIVRSTGSSNLYESVLAKLPFPPAKHVGASLRLRALRMNCINRHYEPLWNGLYESNFERDGWTRFDPRLREQTTTREWSPHVAGRSDFERRQLLIEIDVLAAISLGLALEELVTIYRSQFSVLRQFERERIFDQHARIAPTSKTAAGNPAVSLVELAATLKEQAGFDVHAEYHPDGSNTQELRKQKIRLGKKEADVLGVSERCAMGDLLAETEVRWSDDDHPEGRPVRLVGLRYTDPGLEPRMERVYPTPWTRCDREADYRQAWAEFERRLGKKRPESAPL